MTINRSQMQKQISKGKSKIKKIIKGLSKASKTHAKQARTLKSVLKNGKRSKSRNR